MKRGKLWGPSFMRLGVWLDTPEINGYFIFQTTDGETISIGPLRTIAEWSSGSLDLYDDQGRRFGVEVAG